MLEEEEDDDDDDEEEATILESDMIKSFQKFSWYLLIFFNNSFLKPAVRESEVIKERTKSRDCTVC